MQKLIVPVLAAGLAIACSQKGPSSDGAAPAAPRPLAAGVDVNGFDKSVGPQDDLYRYVNGAWLAKTGIPADRGSYGGFVETIDRTQDRLKGIVEEAAKATGNQAPSP